jgi:presenilin-like A22 family membrane protease
MDDYGSITFTREFAEGILVVAEDYFEQAFADAHIRTGSGLPALAGALCVGALALSCATRQRGRRSRPTVSR